MTLLRDLGVGDLAVQRVPDPAGHRDAGAAHRAPFRERRRRSPTYLAKRPEVCARSSIRRCRPASQRQRAEAISKAAMAASSASNSRAAGSRAALHRRAPALLSRRQYRRRAQPRDPSRRRPPIRSSSREDQLATGVSPRLCAPFGRHRAYRRHHRRSRPGVVAPRRGLPARPERRDERLTKTGARSSGFLIVDRIL